MNRLNHIFTLFTLLLILPLSGCQQQEKVSPEEAKTIAEEAYIYAYPMLEHYKTMFVSFIWEDSPAYRTPFNTLDALTVLQTPKDTAVVRPNNDTFYPAVGLDLRREPMVVTVPAITDNRYYSFQLIDMYTHNFDYIGTRTTGFDAGNYLIAGPSWDGGAPEEIDTIFQTECDFVLVLGRTQVYGEEDTEEAKAVIAGYKAQPLSAFLGEPAPPETEPINFPPYDPEKASSAEFISYFNFFLEHLEQQPSEQALFERFKKIGIAAGQPFDVESLDPEVRSAIEDGIDSALNKIEKETGELGSVENGWMLISGAFGNREAMEGKYLTRAAAAMFGIYGNDLEEAFYPATESDADGEPLDGSQHNYILHFEKDEIPQVNAFWSLTMYSLPKQLLVENELNRYKIGSATEGLQYNDDGSLDIYIQKENPGKERASNWLPAYDGRFSLQARLYWPKEEALDPLYAPPAVEKNTP